MNLKYIFLSDANYLKRFVIRMAFLAYDIRESGMDTFNVYLSSLKWLNINAESGNENQLHTHASFDFVHHVFKKLRV